MLTRHHLLKEAWPGHRNEPIGGHTKHPATAPAWAAAAVGADPEVLPPSVIVGTLGAPGSSCSSKSFSIRINVMAMPAHVMSPQKWLPQPQSPYRASSQHSPIPSPECTRSAAAPGWAWHACPCSRRHPFVILHFKVSFEVSRTVPRIGTRCFLHMRFGGQSNMLWSHPPNPPPMD